MSGGANLSKTILFVSGFSTNLRAKDLAYEFERYGRLIRCDIPALKSPTSSPYAFVEFRSEACAEDAFYDMHGRSIDRRRIAVQWAKNTPGSSWRTDVGGPPAARGRGPPQVDSRRRSRSPPRREAPRERERERSRSRSPVRARESSAREGSARREDRAASRDQRDKEEDEGRKRREASGDDE